MKVDYKKRRIEKKRTMKFEIPTPEELTKELEEDDRRRKDEEFRKQLLYLISPYLKDSLKHMIKNKCNISMRKDLLNTKLSDYSQDYPAKSVKELLQEKGWKVTELDEELYEVSQK